MSISSTMLVSLLMVMAAVGAARAYLNWQIAKVHNLARAWTKFHDSTRAMLEQNPSAELLDWIVDMTRVANKQNGGWFVARIICKRVIRRLRKKRGAAVGAAPISAAEFESFATVLFSAFNVAATRQPIPGVIIRLWMVRMLKLAKAYSQRKPTSVPADMVDVGYALHYHVGMAA